MARPIKKGLDYFSLDVNFYNDIKIRKIVRRKGGEALSVYTVLLCNIYEKGYYLEWSDDVPFLISEATGFEEDKVKSFILYCIEIGLFDKEMFDAHHVITSLSIQKRYSAICALTKRKFDPSSPYLLTCSALNNVSSEETTVKSEETDDNSEKNGGNNVSNVVNSGKSTQRKENKKERKENKGGTDVPSSSPEPTTPKNDDINLLAFMDFFNRTMQEHGAQIPTITQISGKRKQALLARFKQHGKEALRKAVINAATSTFLNGGGSKPFVASFDWIMRPNNFPKVLEGNYSYDLSSNNNSSHGTGQQLTAQQRIDAELERAAEYAKGMLARNEASIRDGVQEKVW